MKIGFLPNQESREITLSDILQQISILEEKRCLDCKGLGKVWAGCTMTHDIYWSCPACFGTGKKRETPREEKSGL